MWNQALRRIVHAEESQQEERRRQQLLQAASTASSASNGTTATPEDPAEASVSPVEGTESVAQPATSSNDEKAPQTTTETQYIDEDDEDYLQKHLLSSPTSAWSLLEDTQQANCLALNASNTLLAVGERDGRVTIWDNTTIRVITRELDPTLIALPAVVESLSGEDKTAAGQSDKAASVTKTKTSTDAGDGDGSVENDDTSARDEDEVRTEDNGSTADDPATATEEENESEETKTEDELDTSGGGVILTLADLRVVKTSLKVVSQCEWSCDSRWLFVGCEEKSTRRARLCVWDVEAATLVSAFRFDGAINTLSAHPNDPKLLIISYNNSRPVLLDVRSGDRTELVNVPLDNSQFTQPAALSNSRYAALVCCARYGRSGKRIYCVTSKSTMGVMDATTFNCIDSIELTVLVQFVDLSVNVNETALLITSSKGIHEFVISENDNVEILEETSNKQSTTDTASDEHTVRLREVAVHSTGAVRAPWAVCRFSGDEEFVVGTPVVRHLHVGENGLYTWHRASVVGRTTAQHNVGIKDGVLAFAWDHTRHSVLAVSTGGALHVREEQFTTTWPGAMYPAGFRLVTDNELHLEVFDRDEEERKREKEKLAEAAKHECIDVFTIQRSNVEFPSEYDQRDVSSAQCEIDKLRYLPAIPIVYYHRRHLHLFQGPTYHEDKHFGLGQSVFEPLKDEPGEPKASKSKSRKSATNGASNSKSQKRRRR